MYNIRHISPLISLLLLLLICSEAGAQNNSRSSTNNTNRQTLNIRDTIRVSQKDTLNIQDEAPSQIKDSLKNMVDSIGSALQDSIKRAPAMVDKPAFSTARDSIIEDFSGGRRIIYYYGDVKVEYGEMKLSAEYMAYNLDTKIVYASGVKDTLGNIIGKPQMEENGKTYTMEEVYFNMETGKSKIKNMMTQEEEGFLHGKTLKMMPDKSINIADGKYTVCDLEHPHFYLALTAATIQTKPTQKTVFGPAFLVLEDVPLPLALPFGFVPKRPERASGILFPTYGEEVSRGFYLRDLGYYFVVGDHFDVSLTGDIYTLGSWSGTLTSRYKLRYKFDGSFMLKYSNDVTGERGSTDFSESKNFSVQWSHSQDSKARPGTSFRASVNFSSPSNNKYNSYTVQEAMNNQISSSISYSKNWSKMSLSINGLHSQNSRDSSYSITLPNLTFNVNRFFPFKRKVRVGKEKIYEKFSMSYSTTFQNRINFKAREVKEPDFMSKMKNGMNHRFAIGLPSFTIFKFLNFSPNVNYGMDWHFQDQTKVYNPTTDRVESVVSDQFSTFGVTQDFSASLSMSTRLYGFFTFKGKSNLQAIRHMMTPQLSFSYRPELGTAINGYRTFQYTDKNGVDKSLDYNRFEGGMFSPPGKGQTAAISFSMGNNIEAKMLNKLDTTGTGTKKVKLLDQLSFSGSYNFMADSIKLSTISVTANTTIFQKIGLNGNVALDPYAVDEKGKKYNQFNIMKPGGGSLFRLTNASFSTSYSFTGDGKYEGNDGSKEANKGGQNSRASNAEVPLYTRIYHHPVTGEYIPGGWVYYMNPNIPWSLNLSYSFSYSLSYQYANERLNVKHNFTNTLGISGQIKLTRDLNFSLQSGVDLTKMKITTTQLSATYDLHCFQISVSWIPSGQWESWSFRINAKAAALADLLQYKKSSSYMDNRYQKY